MFGKLGTALALVGVALCLTTSVAVAVEGTVTKMDKKGATVRMEGKEYRVGRIRGVKVGDKVTCTEAGGRTSSEGTTGMPGGPAGGMSGGTTGGTTGGTSGDMSGSTAGGTTGTPGGRTGGTAGTATTAMQMTCTKR